MQLFIKSQLYFLPYLSRNGPGLKWWQYNNNHGYIYIMYRIYINWALLRSTWSVPNACSSQTLLIFRSMNSSLYMNCQYFVIDLNIVLDKYLVNIQYLLKELMRYVKKNIIVSIPIFPEFFIHFGLMLHYHPWHVPALLWGMQPVTWR